MRFIDEIIQKVKEHSGISGLHKLYLIKQIETAPTLDQIREFKAKHQFKSDLSDDQKCLCGQPWDVPVHQ